MESIGVPFVYFENFENKLRKMKISKERENLNFFKKGKSQNYERMESLKIWEKSKS